MQKVGYFACPKCGNNIAIDVSKFEPNNKLARYDAVSCPKCGFGISEIDIRKQSKKILENVARDAVREIIRKKLR